MLEQLKAFVRQIVQHLQTRTEPMSDALKEKLTGVLSLVRDKIQQLQAGKAAVQEEAPITPVSPFAVPQTEELLWILSGGDEKNFVNFLSNFPDEDLRPLLRNPAELQSVIENLKSRNLISEPGEADGIPEGQLKSSNVYGVKYMPEKNELYVRFHNNSVYKYQGVPPYIANIIIEGLVPAKTSGQNKYSRWWRGKIPSRGASVSALLNQGHFPYTKIK